MQASALEPSRSPATSSRIPLSQVPVEFVDALLYNGDMRREQLLDLPDLAGWSIDRLNHAIELAKMAEAIIERDDGLIVLEEDTVRRRVACYG